MDECALFRNSIPNILQVIKSEREEQLIIIREKLRVCHHLSTITPLHMSHYILYDYIIGVAKFLFFGE